MQRAVQFGMKAQRHIADCIEKVRAAIRHLETAHAVFMGATGCAFDMAEEERFCEATGNRGAIHGDERLPAAPPAELQRPSDHSSFPVALSPWISTVVLSTGRGLRMSPMTLLTSAL